MRIAWSHKSVPNSLLLLLLSLAAQPQTPVYAQSSLQLDKISAFSISAPAKSLSITLPQTSNPVILSVELCTDIAGQQGPNFFVRTSTTSSTSTTSLTTRSSSRTSTTQSTGPGSSASNTNGEEIILDDGLGVWKSRQSLSNGGTLNVQLAATTGTWNFSVAISDNSNGPLHALFSAAPLFGDSTGSSALLFAPPIPGTDQKFVEPSFPNYTLPDANPPAPTPPNNAPNDTLVIVPTSSLMDSDGRPKTELGNSACFLQSLSVSDAAVNADSISSKLVLRDQEEGWRTQFIVTGLQSSTNYTFYTISNSGGVQSLSQPAYFTTKSSGFACPLVHSLPFCPQVAYSAPFPPVDAGTYDETNFPAALQDTLLTSLGNFTTSLKVFACGRDLYSIIQSCSTCERAYRNWLCSVLIPRCGEATPALDPPAALVDRAFGSSNTSSSASRIDQTVFSNDDGPTQYTELLPCLETCHQVDRACPPHMQWACPRITAEKSYGVGFIDKEGEDVSGGGIQGAGTTGVNQDRWGRVWCNGPV